MSVRCPSTLVVVLSLQLQNLLTPPPPLYLVMPRSGPCSKLVPLVIAHCKSEDEEEWRFVFGKFKEAFGGTAFLNPPKDQGVHILVDMQGGSTNALDAIFAGSEVVTWGYCVQHREVLDVLGVLAMGLHRSSLFVAMPCARPAMPSSTITVSCLCSGCLLPMQRNILDTFRHLPEAQLDEAVFLFKGAAAATNKAECAMFLSFLHDRQPDVHKYVTDAPLDKWALSHRKFPFQSALRTNPVGTCWFQLYDVLLVMFLGLCVCLT